MTARNEINNQAQNDDRKSDDALGGLCVPNDNFGGTEGEPSNNASTPGNMPWYSSVIIGSLVVICSYMLVRSCIYFYFPLKSQYSWFFRDTVMTIPRLGAFTALIFLNGIWKSTHFEIADERICQSCAYGLCADDFVDFLF